MHSSYGKSCSNSIMSERFIFTIKTYVLAQNLKKVVVAISSFNVMQVYDNMQVCGVWLAIDGQALLVHVHVMRPHASVDKEGLLSTPISAPSCSSGIFMR